MARTLDSSHVSEWLEYEAGPMLHDMFEKMGVVEDDIVGVLRNLGIEWVAVTA